MKRPCAMVRAHELPGAMALRHGLQALGGHGRAEAAARAADGDAAALVALDALSDRIARALSLVISVCDPDVIVFGGGVSNVDWLTRGARRLIAYAFSDLDRHARGEEQARRFFGRARGGLAV